MVIIGSPPRGQREQGRLGAGELAREASREHDTMRPKRGRAGGCGIGHEGKQRVQPLFFPNAKDRISVSNKGNIKQAKSKQGSAKKSNFWAPPRGRRERGGLVGGRLWREKRAKKRPTNKPPSGWAGAAWSGVALSALAQK